MCKPYWYTTYQAYTQVSPGHPWVLEVVVFSFATYLTLLTLPPLCCNAQILLHSMACYAQHSNRGTTHTISRCRYLKTVRTAVCAHNQASATLSLLSQLHLQALPTVETGSICPVSLPPTVQSRRATCLKLQGKCCCVSCSAGYCYTGSNDESLLQTLFTGQHVQFTATQVCQCPPCTIVTTLPASATLITKTAWPKLFCTRNLSEQQLTRWSFRTAVSPTPEVQIVTCTSWPQLLLMRDHTGQVNSLQPRCSIGLCICCRTSFAESPTSPQFSCSFAEQKLLHRLAKEARSIHTAPSTTVRQKLFGSTLQGFAAAEEQVCKAFPTSSTHALIRSPAQGLQLPSATKETVSILGKRKGSMDDLTGKKPRLSGGSHTMPMSLAFDAAEKLMQSSVMATSEE